MVLKDASPSPGAGAPRSHRTGDAPGRAGPGTRRDRRTAGPGPKKVIREIGAQIFTFSPPPLFFRSTPPAWGPPPPHSEWMTVCRSLLKKNRLAKPACVKKKLKRGGGGEGGKGGITRGGL